MPDVLNHTFHGLSEWPLATREECWRAYRPAQKFSESAFQLLHRKHLVSPGVRLTPRVGGKVTGQERHFSRLNLLALDSYRLGDAEEARRLSGLAADIERKAVVQELVDQLAAADGPSQPQRSELTRIRDLLNQVCAITDSEGANARHAPPRLPAHVDRMVEGLADLPLRMGYHVYYSRSKLSHIGRDELGALVVLYLIDLGGTDELVRARPAVSVDEQDPPGGHHRPAPGAFDRVVTDVTGPDAELLLHLVNEDQPERPIDLTGLRTVR